MKLLPCAWFVVFLTVLIPPAFSKTVEELEPRLDKIERDIRRIYATLNSIKSDQAAFSRQIDSVKRRVDSVDGKTDDLDSSVDNLKSRVSDLRRR